MKYTDSEEFDINVVYAKLTSKSVPRVRACDFFGSSNELELLQEKMKSIAQMRKVAHGYKK